MAGRGSCSVALTVPATGANTVTGNLATQNSPLNPLGNGYYCDTYTVSLTMGTDYMFNMSGNNGSAAIPQPTGNAQIFLLDPSNNQVNLNTGGDPNLYWYGPGNLAGGTPGWAGAINPNGGANLVYTAHATGTYTLVCTTTTQNSQFLYPLMAMQINTVAAPQYTVSSFPYNNNNATMCQLNTYNGYMSYFFADMYTLQLPAGLFIITATMAPGASGAQDIAMILYDVNGNQVATGLPNANGNYPLDSPGTFQFTTSTAGTYTLVLESDGAAFTGPGAAYQPYIYSLSVVQPPSGTTALSFPPPVPISGTTATVTVTVIADNSRTARPPAA